MDGVDDIVREFLLESHENLDQLDRDLVALESEPGSRALLGSIFRTVHTIKGTSGFLGFSRLERLTHVGESLLVELRDGERTMDPATTDVLLGVVDRVRDLLAAIDADGTEGDIDVEVAVNAVLALESAGPAIGEVTTGGAVAPPTKATESPAMPREEPPAAPAEPPAPAAPAGAAPAEPAGHEPGIGRSGTESAIRVDTDLLDTLVRQVGELVLARNRISRLAGERGADPELVSSAQQLGLIASELQEGVMRTRMQPIENAWSRMPRIVRDLASSLGREVALRTAGGDTELDRGLLEAVKDPLTHLVRNAVDHGIEPPAERLAAGKDRQGTLTLRASHAGGQVVVEVEDDGRGIDPAKVGERAVARGLRTAEQVAAASDAELLQLLFLPGFSTAEKVTNVSGRGVGMDVVRSNVEAVGGSVDVESSPGDGTVWRLRIPLTMAIMPALTVVCAGDVYALPQAQVVELVALGAQRGGTGVEHVHDAPVYRLRGELLPLVPLRSVLGLAADDHDGDGDGVIAVVQAGAQRLGVLVDRVLSTEEIVVTPLSHRLKAVGTYAGATVLGDGSVALILDLQAIGRTTLGGDGEGLVVRNGAEPDVADLAASAVEQVLVAGVGGRRLAMPLASVARLESLRASQVELVGGREVVRYRDAILPLARLARTLGTVGHDRENLLVVVFSGAGRSVGLVVDEVLDIVEDDVSRRSDVDDLGLLGSTVIGDRVTELLDVRSAVLSADPGFELELAELVGAGR